MEAMCTLAPQEIIRGSDHQPVLLQVDAPRYKVTNSSTCERMQRLLALVLLSSRWCHCRNCARCCSSCLCRLLRSPLRFFVLVLPALPTLPALNRKLSWAPGCGSAEGLTGSNSLTGKAAACADAPWPLPPTYKKAWP